MYLFLAFRLVHVVSGILWVGMMAFSVLFVTPAIRDAGVDGVRVNVALQRRGVTIAMPVFALATLISGMWLFRRLSGGSMAFLHTSVGAAFAAGGAAAFIAFLLGVAVLRPAMARATALTRPLASAATEEERLARWAEIDRLRGRALLAGNLVLVLLLLAAGAMAVARYV